MEKSDKPGLVARMVGRFGANGDAGVRDEIKALRRQLDDYVTEDYLSALTSLNEKDANAEATFAGGGKAANLDYFKTLGYDLTLASLQRLMVSEGWFYIVVSALANTIASLPLKLEKCVVTYKDGAAVETYVEASGEPEGELFKYPNDLITAFEFYYLLSMDLLGCGNAFIYVDKGEGSHKVRRPQRLTHTKGGAMEVFTGGKRNTDVQGIYRLNPACMTPVPSEDHIGIGHYEFVCDAGVFRYRADEIIAIRMPNPADPLFGLAPIVPVLKNVLLDKQGTEHIIRFYKQGARLGGAVETTKKMNKEQLARLQRSFELNFTGKHNHYRTLILPEGMQYKPIEQNPLDTDLIAFSKSNREPILATYRVPPIKVSLMDGATYSNALIQEATYFTNAVIPALTLIEQSLNNSPVLLPQGTGLRIKFDLAGIAALQEDLAAKAGIAKAQLEGGKSINEVRQDVWKLGPVKDGDIVPVVARAKAVTVNAYQLPADGMATDIGTTATPATQPTPADSKPVAQQPLEGTQAEAATVSQIALNGAQVTSMLDVVSRVAYGELPRESGVAMLIGGFGLTRESAEAIMGQVGNTFTLTREAAPAPKQAPVGAIEKTEPQQGDTVAITDVMPTGGTFEQRVAMLVEQYVAEGTPLAQAIQAAIQQAILEGFTPTPPDAPAPTPPAATDGADEAPAPMHPDAPGEVDESKVPLVDKAEDGLVLHTVIISKEIADTIEAAEKVAKEFGKIVTHRETSTSWRFRQRPPEDFIQSSFRTIQPKPGVSLVLGVLKEKKSGTPVAGSEVRPVDVGTEVPKPAKDDVPAATQPKLHPFDAKQLDDHWQALSGTAIEELVAVRAGEAERYFKALHAAVNKRLGKSLRGTWVGTKLKADDTSKLVPDQAIDEVLAAEKKRGSKALPAGNRYGYDKALVEYDLKYPDAQAAESMALFGADKITQVTETTKVQLRAIISDAVDQGESIGEIGKRINTYFEEATPARVQTIARTETLAAISMGQSLKNDEFKTTYPDDAGRLRKLWISSRDARVRGNPEGLYPDTTEDHFHMDGEVVEVDEAFSNGLQFPRDPKGEAGQVINCRCAFITFLAEDAAQVAAAVEGEQSPMANVDAGPEQKGAALAAKVHRGENETYQQCIARAIPVLVAEGKDQDQAVAMAYEMCKLPKKGAGTGNPHTSGV